MPQKKLLQKLLDDHELSFEEMHCCMDGIMDGSFSDAVVSALLVLLQKKGVSAAETVSALESLMARAAPVAISADAIDTCGTGGDHAGTYNISTMASIIANGAGVAVAKHGNRSVTSSCGSADVLEALGFRIDLPPEASEVLFAETGFAFLFAPLYHPSMKRVAAVRRELGVRTIFNMLGPLLNPARSRRQLVGVFSPELMELYAAVLLRLPTRHAFVVHSVSADGIALDEPAPDSVTRVIEIRDGVQHQLSFHPEEFGLRCHSVQDIQGGSRETNAALIRAILDGSAKQAYIDSALYTSAMACYVGGDAASMHQGFAMAAEALSSGAAERKFAEICRLNRDLAALYCEDGN